MASKGAKGTHGHSERTRRWPPRWLALVRADVESVEAYTRRLKAQIEARPAALGVCLLEVPTGWRLGRWDRYGCFDRVGPAFGTLTDVLNWLTSRQRHDRLV